MKKKGGLLKGEGVGGKRKNLKKKNSHTNKQEEMGK